jgi:hypothetical protein
VATSPSTTNRPAWIGVVLNGLITGFWIFFIVDLLGAHLAATPGVDVKPLFFVLILSLMPPWHRATGRERLLVHLQWLLALVAAVGVVVVDAPLIVKFLRWKWTPPLETAYFLLLPCMALLFKRHHDPGREARTSP